MMHRVLMVTAVAVAAVLGSCGAARAAGAAGTVVTPAASPWTVQPTPMFPNDLHGYLTSVSCPSAARCVAIGDMGRRTWGSALAETWNGTKWVAHNATKPGVNTAPFLFGVSCPAADSCVAVGEANGEPTSSVALAWNGTTWTSMPGIGVSQGILQGVSCVSASDCTAVGFYNDGAGTLTMSWNGGTWTVDPTPTQSQQAAVLSSVSCASATSCLAVGNREYDQPLGTLAESWNGHTWRLIANPQAPAGGKSGYVNAVSCASAAECVTVGYYTNSAGQVVPLGDRWNGSGWTAQTLPVDRARAGQAEYLNAVSCPTVTSCTAVGAPSGLAETWNGQRWTRQGVPRPAGIRFRYILAGVSCAAARTCEAVGTGSTRWQSSSLPVAAGE